ncbi:MAG: GNAT family N-acetyltransferase [Flammeovirgaceae bacterium]|nr:GNAT family N-acetyltransferase [Flammeovirgaceae bacterium]
MGNGKWFNEVTLETNNIKLQPIKRTNKEDLINATNDGNLSNLWFTNIPTMNNIDSYITKAIEDFDLDKGLTFIVIDKKTNKVIGTTRFTNATPEHRRLEIGYTWYSKTFQKTYVNSECKMLMLTHAFEVLKAIAVEFRTNWYNFPSRNAILRLGAKQDGVLRNHQIMPDGSLRDTVVFSIIEGEWQTCKRALKYKIEQIHQK